MMNRLANCHNKYQGDTKKVLCVCSAGLLRSPTAAVVLSQEPFNFNTRAAGMSAEFALVPVDKVLLEWADEIVCMEPEHAEILSTLTDKPIICLGISDNFSYRDPVLMGLISKSYNDAQIFLKAEEAKNDGSGKEEESGTSEEGRCVPDECCGGCGD